MKALLPIISMAVFVAAGVALAAWLSFGKAPLPFGLSGSAIPDSILGPAEAPSNRTQASSSLGSARQPLDRLSASPSRGLTTEQNAAIDYQADDYQANAAIHQKRPPGHPASLNLPGVASVPARGLNVVGKPSGPSPTSIADSMSPPSGNARSSAELSAARIAATHRSPNLAAGTVAPAEWASTKAQGSLVVPCDTSFGASADMGGKVEVASLQEELPPPKASSLPSPVGSAQIEVPQNDGLVLQFRETDLRDALHALARQLNLNVLMSNNVQGKVTASLNGLSPEDALSAVVAAHGLALHRQGDLVYVGTPADIQTMLQTKDVITTRVYRPNYVTAKEIKTLVEPLLTPEIGKVTLSTAAEVGIAPDPTQAGGNAFAGVDIVLVRDYETVLKQVGRIVAEVDVRPAQVAIEAMIVSVNLDDKDQFGVSFELLRNKGHIRLGWGFPPTDLDQIAFDSGLKVAYLDASVSSFITALESIGDTNVIASPRLLVLNKHRAEILIGKELGYVSTTITETSASQTVDFLKVGAQLIIRPFISNDGLIRMEVHPELSTGSVQITNNFTVPNKDTTQVTTNIMVPDGATVIIGGLMREDLQTSSSQLPFLGNLPLVGAVFRNKTETTGKQEIIVLITPHIMGDYPLAMEGSRSAMQNLRRQETYADTMSPLGKRSAARHYLQRAREAAAAGRVLIAMRFANLAVRFDPTNLEAIAFRDSLRGVCPPDAVEAAIPLSSAELDREELSPELLDALEATPPTGSMPPPPPPARDDSAEEVPHS